MWVWVTLESRAWGAFEQLTRNKQLFSFVRCKREYENFNPFSTINHSQLIKAYEGKKSQSSQAVVWFMLYNFVKDGAFFQCLTHQWYVICVLEKPKFSYSLLHLTNRFSWTCFESYKNIEYKLWKSEGRARRIMVFLVGKQIWPLVDAHLRTSTYLAMSGSQ